MKTGGLPKKAIQILNEINDPHFTTELALFNLEINLDPIRLGANCFSKMKKQLDSLLSHASHVCDKNKTKIILTGILPTIGKKELHKSYMTPSPRYDALNDVMREFRGSDFRLHLKGVDEMLAKHESVLFEACNTSFQLHLQIAPDDFIKSYNWAQAISGPVLGISCNSPILMGRELWYETRIALFQQSLDTRSSSYNLKDQQPRVAFGTQWAKGNATAVFKEDIALHEVALSKPIVANSVDEVLNNKIPDLDALKLHNGTVYRWNRPCYGVGGGRPHLRIENRYLPSGPTTTDEIANFVFWVGLMIGRPKEFDDMPRIMDFRDAKSNFVKAARTGKESVMIWKERSYTVSSLIKEELIPISKAGLIKANVDEEDIEKYLGIILSRVDGQTGARWQMQNFRRLSNKMKKDNALVALTKSMHENQSIENSVDKWKLIKADAINAASLVSHIMSTALLTVKKDDLLELAACIMDWNNIHHMPVINRKGELIGLITDSYLKRCMIELRNNPRPTVEDIMIKEVHHVEPSTTINEAIGIMEKHQIGCLPVVSNNNLVGIISKKDIVD